MTRTSAAIPALTIAIISGHSLVALGFPKKFSRVESPITLCNRTSG